MATVGSPTASSVTAAVLDYASKNPERVALTTAQGSTTYGELLGKVLSCSHWLSAKGVHSGDRLLVGADSKDDMLPVAYFAAHLLGAIAAPLDVRSSDMTFASCTELIEPTLTLWGEERDELSERLRKCTTYERNQPPLAATTPNKVSEIIFTSGTTGRPKGVVLTHANVLASTSVITQFVGASDTDTEVLTIPLTHSFGLGRLRSILATGGHLVIIQGMTFPQQIFQALTDLSGTGLSCVPSGMRILMGRYADQLAAAGKTLRYIEMGSAYFGPDEKRQLMQLLPNTRLCMHYGLTEASRSTFSEFHHDIDHLESVGRPSSGVEVKILDEQGEECPEDQPGELFVRSACVMDSYWRNGEATVKSLDPKTGWLRTGDRASLDAGGYVHLFGRKADTINCGGEKLQPDLIERIAEGQPGVVDAACCGIPDPDGVLGDIPLVCVVTDLSTFDSRALALQLRRALAPTLATAHVKVVESIPRTESGKIKRKALRENHLAQSSTA